ncbi:hypothetical protein [Extensimonas vulgaris]|uniref:Predicted 3'-5' exonuclease PolB-like domain-containing protein n=1 Tax=Extensimonas vulgaris TaxID=1031594 RepID=A0A369ARU9_9BURK|nr:hypothetical protein [Extensimonas vulgaris]RCX11845.1 hypothetical protein DFR45_101377 [Extensimonas vulgaris]TWI39064.1 hypothetical protein IP95_01611 [Extensimonas vulgaris]
MTAIFFDIETIPSQAPGAREQARQSVRAPGTLRKAESIAAWHAEHGDEAAEELYKRQALSPSDGEVCCVGFALDDADPVAVVRELNESEGDYLRRALAVVDEHLREANRQADPLLQPWIDGAPVYPVGFNVLKFDLPFLRWRCWANRIATPSWLPGPFARAPRDLCDVMLLAAGPTGMMSLDKVCRALGIASPKAEGVDGSQVLDLWRNSAHADLAAYCCADVAATRACWHVMQGSFGAAEPAVAQEATA